MVEMRKNRQIIEKVLIFLSGWCKIVFVSRDGAAWSARLAHNQEVVGSNPTPATLIFHIGYVHAVLGKG